jgi:hypothetical protein
MLLLFNRQFSTTYSSTASTLHAQLEGETHFRFEYILVSDAVCTLFAFD